MTQEELLEVWWLLSEELNEAVKAPLNESDQPAYGYLFGIACALQESLALLVRTNPQLARDRLGLLPTSGFAEYVTDTGRVHWEKDERMRLYGCEFFLNKAQANIAAALDAITNRWIELKLPGPYTKSAAYVRDDFFYSMPLTRLRIAAAIRAFQTRTQPSHFFSSLEKSWGRFGRLTDTESASPVIRANMVVVRETVASESLKSLIREGARHRRNLTLIARRGRKRVRTVLRDTDCLAIVIARVNTFKHLPQGLNDRNEGFHLAEWVITFRAMRAIRVLLADMRKSVA